MSLATEINRWNEESKQLLIQSYSQKGFKASGNWALQLEPQQTTSAFNINIKMLGADYTDFMINGRGPTSPTGPFQSGPKLIDLIKQWVKDKNLSLNPYAITNEIHKFGTKQYRNPDPKKQALITDVYTDQYVESILDIIRKDKIQELTNTIIKILK